jgi:hypothetical protein
MNFWRGKELLKRLDTMLDSAIDGAFKANTYDESMLSKIQKSAK